MRNRTAQQPPVPCPILAPRCAQVCVGGMGWGEIATKGCCFRRLEMEGYSFTIKGGIAKSVNPSRVYSEDAVRMAKLRSWEGSCGLGWTGLGEGVQVAMVTTPFL